MPFRKRKPSLLLIEDNPADIELVQEWVRERGLDLEIGLAGDSDEAMARLEAHYQDSSGHLPDLIMLDINLPRVSGLDFLKTIKDDLRFCRIPIVMLTSSKAQDDVDRSYSAHANAYVHKGVELDRFFRSLNCIYCLFFETAVLPQN